MARFEAEERFRKERVTDPMEAALFRLPCRKSGSGTRQARVRRRMDPDVVRLHPYSPAPGQEP